MLALGAALAVLLAVRIVALRFSVTDLFFDEAQYWTWSLEPAFGYYSKPPLIAWLIRGATAVCGGSEVCIRLPSPVLHTVTAVLVLALGKRLYGAAAGVWSAIVFATLPGISVSAGIISTDVPLLLFWALALVAFVEILERHSWWPAILLGVALGLGLNAKYAMIYFVLCGGLYIAFTPDRRSLLRDARLWVALGLAALLIVPNLYWNLTHGFATFSHTADNAKWTGSLLNPLHAFEFIASQFAVFGPILFAALAVIAVRAWRTGVAESDRLLLAFALPVIALVGVQAFLSRAHANWAALAYVSGSVLVTTTLLRQAQRWLKASLALHVAFVVGLGLATAHAGSFMLPGIGDPFARTLGWRQMAQVTRHALEDARRSARPFAGVITDDRAVTAELLYYMRDEPTPVLAWRQAARPHDHYELTRPFQGGAPEAVLLVSIRRKLDGILSRFDVAERMQDAQLPAGAQHRRVVLYRLEGFKGQPNQPLPQR
jgi:4-amino-4-deoxy-L-arabinose transferase-like glycosyltransferase